jgi:hypothetical protein
MHVTTATLKVDIGGWQVEASPSKDQDSISINKAGHSGACLPTQLYERHKQVDCGPGRPGQKGKNLFSYLRSN